MFLSDAHFPLESLECNGESRALGVSIENGRLTAPCPSAALWTPTSDFPFEDWGESMQHLEAQSPCSVAEVSKQLLLVACTIHSQ